MKKTLIGFIVFVSYNRDQYEFNEIALDDMTFKEFIRFKDNDKVNCMSVEITPIYNTTLSLCGGSDVNDDSIYWFISADLVDTNEYKEFFDKYKAK